MAIKLFSSLLLLTLSSLCAAAPNKAAHSTATTTSASTVPYHKFNAASTSLPSQTPKATLLPAIHWNRNLRDYDNLIPSDTSLLYYAEQSGPQDPYTKHLFVAMNATFTAPTVVLEHTAYISHVKCNSKGLTVTIKGEKAFETVKKSWDITNLRLLTYSEGCAQTHDNARTYWQASAVSFSPQADGGLAQVTCAVISQNEGLASAELLWGTHKSSSPIGSGGNSSLVPRDTTVTDTQHQPKVPCKPPHRGTHHLKAVNWCIPNFDERLDKKIGFKSISVGSFLPALEQAAQSLGLGGVTRRGFFSSSSSGGCGTISSIFGACGGSSSSSSSGGCGTISSIFGACSGSSSSSSSCGLLSSAFGVCSSSDSESLDSGDIPIPLTLPNDSDSPWGPAFKIYSHGDGDDGGDSSSSDSGSGSGSGGGSGGSSSCGFLSSIIGDCGDSPSSSSIFSGIFKRGEGGDGDGGDGGDSPLSASIDLYCIDCGITGDVDIQGTAKFNVLHLHVEEVGVSMTGQMNAGIKLGLDAKMEYSDTWTKQVLSVPASPFEVPGLISIGPVLTLDVALSFDASAEGKMLASVGMQIGPFDAGFDFVGSNNYQSGFEPTYSYDFDADGEIEVTAQLTTPMGIGVGVDIPLLDWSKTISIFDAPGLSATADYKKHYNIGQSGSSSSSSTSTSSGGSCRGIDWHINVVNDIYLNFFDIGDPLTLYSYTSPAIAEGCIALGGGSSSSSSSSNGGSSGGGSSSGGSSSSGGNNGGGSSSGGSSGSGNNGGGSSGGGSSGGGSSGSGNNGGGSGGGSSGSGNNGGGSSGEGSGGGSGSGSNGQGGSSSSGGKSSSSGNHGGSSGGGGGGGGSSSTNPSTGKIRLGHLHGSKSTLFAAPNGNFYVDGQGSAVTEFLTQDETVIGDATGRYFHFYKDAMSAFGVSRMRLSTLDEVPKTAEMFVFEPIEPTSVEKRDADARGELPKAKYVAVDSKGNQYYTVLCSYKNQSPKLFLEAARHDHPALKTEQLIYTVTGGEVQRCHDFTLGERVRKVQVHRHIAHQDSKAVATTPGGKTNSFWH